MKKLTGFAAAALSAAVIASVPALAADSVPAMKLRPAGVKAVKVELTEEQKAEMTENIKAKLDEKLASGELSQEQYDEIIAKVESGDFRGFGGKRHGFDGEKPELTEEQKAEMTENVKAKLDEKLASGELSQEQYDEIIAKVESGDLRGFGGKRHGFDGEKPELTEEQKAEMTENVKAKLDEKLASGELSQEQYDEIIAKVESGDLRGFGGKRHGFGLKGCGHRGETAVGDSASADLGETV